jgi:hypothetical protein
MMTDEEREDLAIFMDCDQAERDRYVRWHQNDAVRQDRGTTYAKTLTLPVSGREFAELHHQMWLDYLEGIEE